MKNKKNEKLDYLVDLLFEVGTLMNMKRMHSQVLHLAKESIGDHSFRTAIITLLLSQQTKVNSEKLIKMALLHDIAESRTGDANYIHKFYSQQSEAEAYHEIFQNIKGKEEIISLLDEYNERKTKESLLAKDADLLDQMLLQQEYLFDRPKDLKRWQNHTSRTLSTDIAKKIAQKITKRNPLQWLYNFSDFKKTQKAKK